MSSKASAVEHALAKFLAMKEAAGAVGKGAIESLPGLARDNPKISASLAGLGGLAAGHALGPSEDSVRKDEDAQMLRRYLAMHGEER